jgi:Nucleotidyltransferase domain
METPGPLPERLASALAVVPGVVAVALGGSRAIGAAHAASDYDIGLYFSERAGLGVDRLLEVVKGLVDEPAAAQVTEVSGWGPWIVGGGWLTIEAMKVDLLYRPIESVDSVVNDCRQGPRERGLSAGASAWLLLRDLDGRGRALPTAQRS